MYLNYCSTRLQQSFLKPLYGLMRTKGWFDLIWMQFRLSRPYLDPDFVLLIASRGVLKPPCRTLSNYRHSRRSTSPSCTRRTPTSVRSSPPNPTAWLRSAPPARACRCRTGRPQRQTPAITVGRAAPPPTSQRTASPSTTPCRLSRPWSSSCPNCPHSNTTRCSATPKVSGCTSLYDNKGFTGRTKSHSCIFLLSLLCRTQRQEEVRSSGRSQQWWLWRWSGVLHPSPTWPHRLPLRSSESHRQG